MKIPKCVLSAILSPRFVLSAAVFNPLRICSQFCVRRLCIAWLPLPLLLTSPTWADDPVYTFNGGNWNTAASWAGEEVPPSGSIVVSNPGANINMRFDSSVSMASFSYGGTANINVRSNTVGVLRTFSADTFNMAGSGQVWFRDFDNAGGQTRELGLSFGTLNVTNGTLLIGGNFGLTGGYTGQATAFSGANTANLTASFQWQSTEAAASPTGPMHFGAVSMTDGSFNFNIQFFENLNTLSVSSLSGGGENSTVRLVNTQAVAGRNGTLVIDGAATTSFDGVIGENHVDDSLGVRMTGSGVQTFTRANTYKGGTEITNGTLALAGNGTLGSGDIAVTAGTWDISGIAGAAYVLSSDQTLSGAGTIIATGKTLTVNGLLAPGNSIGTLTVDGGLLDISGVDALVFELGATGDAIVLTGGADLDIGTLNFSDFDFITVSGFGAGDYTLISGWGALFGDLGVTEGVIGDWDAYLAFDGNSLVLTVIPEPSTLALCFGFITLAFAALRRRRS